MTDSKKAQATSPDALAKTSPQGAVELTEGQLADASGGIIAIAPQSGRIKFDTAQKIDTDPALLLPAVKPGQ